MFPVYIIVTILTAAANTYAAIVDFRRPQWVVDNIARWGGSDSWLFPLGALKAAGALGLLAGIVVPLIGMTAATAKEAFNRAASLTDDPALREYLFQRSA